MEYEPIYVVDYLRSYHTIVELWEENDAMPCHVQRNAIVVN